jgi:hypothetical protein
MFARYERLRVDVRQRNVSGNTSPGSAFVFELSEAGEQLFLALILPSLASGMFADNFVARFLCAISLSHFSAALSWSDGP